METYIFYILAAAIMVFSLLSVITRRVLRAAVYLLFALASSAGIYFMIEYYFLAAVQLLVYVGGVVVLIIFSILLTSQINDRLERPQLPKMAATLLISLAGLVLTLLAIGEYSFTPGPEGVPSPTVAMIGEKMLSYGDGGYVLPFEVISILLLAAMVGAIVIAKRMKDND